MVRPAAGGSERDGPGFLDYRAATEHAPELDAARLINAGIPFATGPVPPAAPFLISGETDDRQRARDCLAAAAYYEAGSDARGQRAVMQVVLNRVRHPAFPSSVCGVVFEGAERRTGCQFTFTCDGALDRHRPSPLAWSHAQQIAMEALSGYTAPSIGYATHYHTDWVHPVWSDRLDKIAAVDTHLFYRGKHVRPSDFSSAYAGAEPRVSKMAFLSPAHAPRPTLPPIDAAAANPIGAAPELHAAAASPLAGASERLPRTAQAPASDIFLATLDPAADPDSYMRLAEMRCAGRAPCKFIGWTDARKRATHVPMPGSAIDAISFSFSRTSDGEVEMHWNCREFPRPNERQCLRRGG